MKNPYIEKIIIEGIYGDRDISWDLNPLTNILIGKNGSGKSTVLKLIDAEINGKKDILEKFGNPYVKVKYSELKYNLDLVFIDTFDTIFNSISECKDSCERNLSPLSFQLDKLLNSFNSYRLTLNSRFDIESSTIQKELDRIMADLNSGNIDEASKIKDLNNEKVHIKNEIFKSLNTFRNIIDGMFADTHKRIDLEYITKATSIKFADTHKRIDLEYITKATSIKFADKNLDFLELSSGEKQLLVIYMSVLLKENKPYILMMDEPENSLHSSWQINFVENIRKLNENVQIIIATHNPLLMLNREGSEIAKISLNSDLIDTSSEGTKYMDVSATLLNYPQVSSLVGNDMRKELERYKELKFKENSSLLEDNEKIEIDNLHKILDNTIASNFLYNSKYFQFLQFINKHKNIDYNKYKEITNNDMEQLLEDFGDYFND